MRRYDGLTLRFGALFLAVAAPVVGIAISAAPASAAVPIPPPSGELFCASASGAVVVTTKPALSDVPSTKPVKITVTGKATCDPLFQVGGKAPITEVNFKQSYIAAVGSTCSAVSPGAAQTAQKVKLTYKGIDGRGRLITVATSKAPISILDTWAKGITTRAIIPGGANIAFAGNEIRVDAADQTDAFRTLCETTGVTSLVTGGTVRVRFNWDG